MNTKTKILLFVLLLFFLKNSIFSTEVIFNFNKLLYKSKSYKLSKKIDLLNLNSEKMKKEEKFDTLFLGIGIVTSTIGAGVLLAGLINLTVTLDAVSINNVPIEANYNVYYSLIGIGSGLIVTGLPFIIISSIRLGIKNKRLKTEFSLKFL